MNNFNIKQFFFKYKIALIAVFLFIIGTTNLLYLNKESKIKEYENLLINKYEFQYSSIYQNFKRLSENTFYAILNKSNIYTYVEKAYKKNPLIQKEYRDSLFHEFEADYSRLLNYDFNQLHFHFPDNTSFLRMHKPSKFGDNLSDIRYSIKKVNQILKPVEGFEIGKIIHGFRFVYPLFNNNLNHIGSVEASISSDYFEVDFEKNFEVDAHFLINKEISKKKMFSNEYEKQITSLENNDYIISNESKEENYHFINRDFYTNKDLQTIKTKMKFSKSFILTKYINGSYLNIYFKNIANVEQQKNSAYLVIYNKSNFIQEIYKNYYKMNIIVILLIVLFILIILKKYNLDKKNKQKNDILEQQAKMASMGEMLNNIAHQWRQPLSVISTAATGVKLKKEFGILKDEDFIKNMKLINQNTQYLSETIDDFRNYFNKQKVKTSFKIIDVVDQSLAIFGETFSSSNIHVIKDIEDITINSYPNELKQVLINLLKNAKDIIEKDGIIYIVVLQEKNNIKIKVKDSGGGVSKEIREKIFEPYFTTKHQNVGTGLGLFMSHEIINKSMHGTLEVKNETFLYKFKNYTGATFTITLNTNKL